MEICYYCHTEQSEVRPYGPNMSWVCFDCATSPVNIEQTNKTFIQQLTAIDGIRVIGEQTGPRPLLSQNQQ